MNGRTFVMLIAVISDQLSDKFLRVHVIDHLGAGFLPHDTDDFLYLGSGAAGTLENADQLPRVIGYREFSQAA
jgi:hypothetical protein